MSFNIVFNCPLIPQNTGTTARLVAATGSSLHLIKPLGFSLEDKYLKRAGLDYWPEVDLKIHESWGDFLQKTSAKREQLWLLSTKAQTSFYEPQFKAGDYLVFGNEDSGLPSELHELYQDRRLYIPMENPNIRSLNLSNSAAIVLYEARRQIGLTR